MNEGKELKSAALNIVKELGLLEMLSHYGDARIVGSVAIDLIVKLDIDIHLLVSDNDLMKTCDLLLRELFERETIREIRVSDYRDDGDGIKLGIDGYPTTSGKWDIDIWMTSNLEATGFKHVETLNTHLTDRHREIILTIKRHYYELGLLRDGISTRIYEAVLEKGVCTVQEFEALV